MKQQTIPKQIQEAFASEVQRYGNHIYHLGKEAGVAYYGFAYPDDLDICLPSVYGYDGHSVVIADSAEVARLFSLFGVE